MDDTVSTRLRHRQLDTLYDMMYQYNQTISQYNNNMTNLIGVLQNSILHTTNTASPVATPRHAVRPAARTTTRPAARPAARPTAIPPPQRIDVSNNIINENSWLFTYMFQPFAEQTDPSARIPLTSTELTRYTNTYSCTESIFADISGNRCPISLDNFQVGDVLCRINHCNHVFKRRALMRWFERSNSCPVCRHNLREAHTDISNNPIDISGNRAIPSSDNAIATDLTNVLNQYINTFAQSMIQGLNTGDNILDISLNFVGLTEEQLNPENDSDVDDNTIEDDLGVD